jgi:hypothetical protein
MLGRRGPYLRRRWLASGTVAIAILLAIPAAASAAFTGPTYVSTGTPDPYRPAVGDLDGDGAVDIAVANGRFGFGSPSPMSVSLLSGNGDGTFQPPVDLPLPRNPYGLEARDLTGDGQADLAVAVQGHETTVFVGPIDDPTPKTIVKHSDNTSNVVSAGDFDGDGRRDLAVGGKLHGRGGGVTVFRGLAHGRLGHARLTRIKRRPVRFAAGDLDRDGKLDLAAGGWRRGGITILRGDGDAGFEPVDRWKFPGYIWDLHAARLDDDRVLDLAALNDDRLTAWVGRGDATFRRPGQRIIGRGGQSFVAKDLGGNREVDFAVTQPPRVKVLWGTRPGLGFTNDGSYEFDLRLTPGIASGLFNADAELDLAQAEASEQDPDPGAVGILLND